MGRYRPPAPPKSPYITRAGFARLKEEEQTLWKRRRKVTAALSAAAAEGDRSENAEYIYRKKQLRELDRRIHYLQKRIPSLKVVDQLPADPEQIFFAAWVTLNDEQENRQRYRIVGPDEIDHAPGYISVDSPLARALLKKQVGEEVTVMAPGGERTHVIEKVEYR